MRDLGRHIVLSVLALSFSLPAMADLTEIKHFDKELAAHGVSLEYSDA
jgi:hypothetical protein